jgi:DNA (cytosine-5)-methyltransferase 1
VSGRKRLAPSGPAFTFVDLFAGIGGLRIPFQELGGKCLFSCEWDRFAQETYCKNFGELPAGDIRDVTAAQVSEHDILLAGFPCQPFSIAGVSKKHSLGREHGFLDKTQGTLFLELARIIEAKRPKAFLLENVRNLLTHDKKRTFRVIRETLEALDYQVAYAVIDAIHWVPQHRERIYIVGFDKRRFGGQANFEFPSAPEGPEPKLKSILEKDPATKYTLTPHLWRYLQDYAAKQKARGNGFGYGMADPDGHTRTLSARYFKDGSEILIATGGPEPRRLTPLECRRLMGFPEDFRIVVSDTEAYRQFGNAVVVPVIRSIAQRIVATLAGLERGSDVFSKQKRSEVMSRIGSRDTGIEMVVRRWLYSHHFGYRLCVKTLFGTPDIVLRRYMLVIFVNGCFWHGHGCHLSSMPKTASEVWRTKLEANRRRDKKCHDALTALGWRVATVWECDLEDHPERVFRELKSMLADTPLKRSLASRRSLSKSASRDCPTPDSVMTIPAKGQGKPRRRKPS